MELSEEMLSELPLLFLSQQPNSFKRSEHKSKQAITYNGFNKVNRESVRYGVIIIFDDDSYKQTQKEKKTFSKKEEAVMYKKIPMDDHLHTLKNITPIIIMNACSFPMLCEELIQIRDALINVFGDKVPHRMKIAIINKSDESNSKLKEWRPELENNNIEIIDHLPRSDYEFLFENHVELPGDFMIKGRKVDLLKLWEINQVHEEENPDGEEIPGEENVALMGISVRGIKPMTQEEDANDYFDIHINGPPQVEDVSPPKRREGASAASEPALDMTSQKAYLDEEDIGIIISDELVLKEDDDAENVVDIKEQSEAAPIHQAHLSKNFNLILHALVNYIRLHVMNAFIVPGSHSVRNPIWTSEVYVIIRIFENGEEIIRRLFKNKKRKKGKKSKKDEKSKKGNHAEDVCLEALKILMKDKNTDNWRIMMYVSYSPCYKCSPEIIKFIKEKKIYLDLRFHTLFQMNRESCKGNNCNCIKQNQNHDQNKKELIHMKHNPQIDSIWIVAADERRELNEVLRLNLPEAILQTLNTQKKKDDIEMASDAKYLGILKGGRVWKETNDQVGGVSGRPVTAEDGVNNNLTAEENADDDLQREEDKLEEATGGAEVGG